LTLHLTGIPFYFKTHKLRSILCTAALCQWRPSKAQLDLLADYILLTARYGPDGDGAGHRQSFVQALPKVPYSGETDFSPMVPITIRAMQPNLSGFGDSPSSTIPNAAVPTVPIPTQMALNEPISAFRA
jgi:hypothetical protein